MMGDEGLKIRNAYVLQEKLNNYCYLLNSYLPDSSITIMGIASDNKDKKASKNNKNFPELNFKDNYLR